MDLMILAEITSKWDISGVWCLAAIPCVTVVLLAYATGPWGGSCTCLFLFLLACLFTTDNSPGRYPGLKGSDMYVTNKAQTKWLKQSEIHLDEPNSIHIIFDQGTSTFSDDVSVYVPAKETYVNSEGWIKMKYNDKRASEDDYYMIDEPIDKSNVPKSDGGWGIPQWVYHPGALTWIFGIAGAPALLGVVWITGKLGGIR